MAYGSCSSTTAVCYACLLGLIVCLFIEEAAASSRLSRLPPLIRRVKKSWDTVPTAASVHHYSHIPRDKRIKMIHELLHYMQDAERLRFGR